MAIAVMTATTRIDQARAEAERLLALAALPQPVKQPDGTTLMLCWAARVSRAYDKLAIARIAGDADSVRRLDSAVKQLRAQYNAALAAGENAAAAWAALAMAQGLTVDPQAVYPAPCSCEGCKAQAAHQNHQAMRAAYTTALYEFAAPNSWTTPPLIDLAQRVKAGDQEANRQLWVHLVRIADAGAAYIAACNDAQVSPNWRLALYPGEGSE